MTKSTRVGGGAALVTLFCIAAGPALCETRNYSIIKGAAPIGAMVVQDDGGREKVHYAFSTNGRGPTFDFDITLDARRLPSNVTVSGTNFIGVPVSETFSTTGNVVSWKTSLDQGSGRVGGFYLPFNEMPETSALLASALADAPAAGLPLFPLGRATLERSVEHSVPLNGKEVRLSLVFVAGEGFAPVPLWLDAKGKLFAAIAPDGETIAKGSEKAAPELRALQVKIIDQRNVAIQARLTKNAPSSILIRNARIYDSEARLTRQPASVLVKGNRIAAIGPDAETMAPSDAYVIDGRGKTLLPGLWDMHVHLQEEVDGLVDLANGITTVRDMGGDINARTDWRLRFASGELAGPRLLLAGLIDGRSPTAAAGVQVSTPEELSRAITLFADDGYQQIKIYSSFPIALLPQAVAEAHARGLLIGGHVPAGIRMDDFVRLGVDNVSHFNFVILNFLDDDVQKRTNTLARMLEPARRGVDIDINSPRVTQSIELWRSHGIMFDATAYVIQQLFTDKVGQMRAAYSAFGDRLPPEVARSGLEGGLAKTEEERALYTRSYDHVIGLLKRMHDAGIPIVPGTDDRPGILLARELEVYVEAGIPAGDALQMATLVAARAMKLDKDLGSVAVGKLADLILVDGDPTRNISLIRNVRTVIRNGTLYDGAALQAVVGMRPPD